MSDLRDRDRVIYDRSPTDHVYHRSPSPSRHSHIERRSSSRYHGDFTNDGRHSPDFHATPRPTHRYYHDDPQPRSSRRDLSPDYEPRRRPAERDDHHTEAPPRRFRSPSPSPTRAPLPRRPTVLRRQSSLDTYDRPRFYEREEYPPPVRREDIHASYGASPLTSRVKTMRIDETRRSEYRDDDLSDRHSLVSSGAGVGLGLGYHSPSGPSSGRERVRERDVVRVSRRRRSRSRDSLTSRTRSRRSSSSSRSGSSKSSSSSPSRATSKSDEYPKKGKTKIPAKLLSKRALYDLRYPFIDEGKTIVILKALSQEQIDQVLRVSDEYKKAELEVSSARSSAGDIEDRREETRVPTPAPSTPAPAPAPAPAPTPAPAPAPGPVIIDVHPRPTTPVVIHQPEVEVIKETVVRDHSPSRCSTYTSTTTCPSASESTITLPTVYERRRRHSGPLVIRSRSKSRSRSRLGRDIRSEIRALEAELYARDHHHHRRHHRHRSSSIGGELVRVDRLGDGQVVMFEEKVERVDEGYRGPRIEKDKKGPPPALVRAMLATIT
ncbi:hypothetical protein SAPIO_CDS6280 [Scedosporium apiospermum]|uniref:DUF8035 domain-containing protein n=1 Tax=Pseudallescheria apiosperma TaxID=563466 RepID=A0A084G4E3_PSEDA|nr:uncharacterized protein SAPIO_CDS6280 [Scedosporium apiospermum]KEZ42205.1 hypothetical protein SAPIO_CDS6280 [Scedosporium apiospermum]